MRANFTGPSYTVGVEEELMIVDAESYALVNAIESLLEDAGAANVEREDGEIKPELMESVLEIATKPCADVVEAGDQLRSLRQNGELALSASSTGMCTRIPLMTWTALSRSSSPTCTCMPKISSWRATKRSAEMMSR